MKKYTINEYWWFNNDTCWKVSRSEHVDSWYSLLTGRMIFYSKFDKEYPLRGTKYLLPLSSLTEKQRKKTKKFKTEDEAVRWLGKIKE